MANGPTSWSVIYRKVTRSVLPALAALHDAGIIHRDVKPANLFVGESGNYKLGDFGLAHFHGRLSKTMTGTTVGTPYYLPPEHLANPALQATPALDIYSAALTMVEAVYGTLPFRELVHKMTFAPKADELEGKGFPKKVAKLFEAALSLEPDERPQSARMWLEELDRATKSSSLSISKADLPRAEEPRRRTPAQVVGLAFFILLSGLYLLWPKTIPRNNDKVVSARERLTELRSELLEKGDNDFTFAELGKYLRQSGMAQKLVSETECSPTILGKYYLARYCLRQKECDRSLSLLRDILQKEGPFLLDRDGKLLLSVLEKESRSQKQREQFIEVLGKYLVKSKLEKRHHWMVKEYLRQLVILGDRNQRRAFFEITNVLFSEPLPDVTDPNLRMYAAYLMAYGLDPSAVELKQALAWSQRALATVEKSEDIWPFRYKSLFILLKCPVESFTGPNSELIDHVAKKVDEYLELSPPESVEQLLLIAKIWVNTYRNESYVKDMAMIDINKIEKDEQWRFHRMRGEILKDKARHEEMMEEFKKAIALAPKERHHYLTHIMRANSFFLRGPGSAKKRNSERVSE